MTLWGKTLKPANKAAVIDSGTTLILADDASVKEFYSTVYGSSQLDNGMWQGEPSSPPLHPGAAC
jgi:hypothetical protein